MNFEGRALAYSTCYPGICFERPPKTVKNLSQHSRDALTGTLTHHQLNRSSKRHCYTSRLGKKEISVYFMLSLYVM
jgi:hypothetical protein